MFKKDEKKVEKKKEKVSDIVDCKDVAKKDWHLCWPPHIDLKIVKGKPIGKIPKNLLGSLKTEKVI